MNGEQVGWVPKEEVEEFMLFIELAIVESRGPKLRGPGAGRWGFHVSFPTRPCVCVTRVWHAFSEAACVRHTTVHGTPVFGHTCW